MLAKKTYSKVVEDFSSDDDIDREMGENIELVSLQNTVTANSSGRSSSRSSSRSCSRTTRSKRRFPVRVCLMVTKIVIIISLLALVLTLILAKGNRVNSNGISSNNSSEHISGSSVSVISSDTSNLILKKTTNQVHGRRSIR